MWTQTITNFQPLCIYVYVHTNTHSVFRACNKIAPVDMRRRVNLVHWNTAILQSVKYINLHFIYLKIALFPFQSCSLHSHFKIRLTLISDTP